VLHDAGAGGVLAWSSHHPSFVWAVAASSIAAALLVFERPRGLSARAYAAQMRDRFRAIQAEFEQAVAARQREMGQFAPPESDAAPAAPARLDGFHAVDHTRR
jgi:hypothetical protein